MATPQRPVTVAVPDPASALSRLKLSDVERKALTRQGFVSSEVRPNNRTIYKLRFRVKRRQQVRYLGSDADFALAVADEVRLLQWRRQQKRTLRHLQAEVAQYRRDVKAALAAHVKEAGLRFHGFSVRRPRSEHA